VKKFLEPLPVEKLWGIGPKTKKVLEEVGVKTIGQLAKLSVAKLVEMFGKIGIDFHNMANGIDESEVVEYYEPKSIGREITFERDTDDFVLIYKALEELIEEIHQELVNSGFYFKTVTVKVRYEDFETHTSAKTLQYKTKKKDIIKSVAIKLLEQFLYSEKRIRLIGVRVSNLIKEEMQKNLAGVA